MTRNYDKSDDLREKRNRLIQQLRQLAAKMEDQELYKSTAFDNEQLRLTQYKIQAGKIIFEIYQSGECSNGTLCQILDYWIRMPYPESIDWNYVQGIESVCWQWYGNHFDDLKKEMGELCAYAHLIRLVIGEFERQDID